MASLGVGILLNSGVETLMCSGIVYAGSGREHYSRGITAQPRPPLTVFHRLTHRFIHLFSIGSLTSFQQGYSPIFHRVIHAFSDA